MKHTSLRRCRCMKQSIVITAKAEVAMLCLLCGSAQMQRQRWIKPLPYPLIKFRRSKQLHETKSESVLNATEHCFSRADGKSPSVPQKSKEIFDRRQGAAVSARMKDRNKQKSSSIGASDRRACFFRALSALSVPLIRHYAILLRRSVNLLFL